MNESSDLKSCNILLHFIAMLRVMSSFVINEPANYPLDPYTKQSLISN